MTPWPPTGPGWDRIGEGEWALWYRTPAREGDPVFWEGVPVGRVGKVDESGEPHWLETPRTAELPPRLKEHLGACRRSASA